MLSTPSTNTIVALAVGHGESFAECDLCFGHSFRTCDEQVRAIDIMPTLLDKIGLQNPNPIHGKSLLRLITSGEKPLDVTALIYSEHGLKFLELSLGAQKSIRTRQWKLTQNSRDGAWELYSLREGPLETTNIADREPAVLKQMKELLGEQEKKIKKVPIKKSRLTPERIEQLDSFGYLEK